MIVDTSAIVAAITNEPDGSIYKDVMLAASELAISAVTVLETKIVLIARFGAAAVEEFDQLLDSGAMTVVPFDGTLSTIAFEAFRTFGKGRGGPAQLNFGDCASYALAKLRREPLLFKGEDFSRTDIEAALPRSQVSQASRDG